MESRSFVVVYEVYLGYPESLAMPMTMAVVDTGVMVKTSRQGGAKRLAPPNVR